MNINLLARLSLRRLIQISITPGQIVSSGGSGGDSWPNSNEGLKCRGGHGRQNRKRHDRVCGGKTISVELNLEQSQQLDGRQNRNRRGRISGETLELDIYTNILKCKTKIQHTATGDTEFLVVSKKEQQKN